MSPWKIQCFDCEVLSENMAPGPDVWEISHPVACPLPASLVKMSSHFCGDDCVAAWTLAAGCGDSSPYTLILTHAVMDKLWPDHCCRSMQRTQETNPTYPLIPHSQYWRLGLNNSSRMWSGGARKMLSGHGCLSVHSLASHLSSHLSQNINALMPLKTYCAVDLQSYYWKLKNCLKVPYSRQINGWSYMLTIAENYNYL